MDNVVQDIGENYEYLRTIVGNQIELQKLDMIEDISTIVGKSLLLIVLFFMGGVLFTALSFLFILSIEPLVGSTLFAILTYTGILLCIAGLLVYFKKALVIKPITNLFYATIKNNV